MHIFDADNARKNIAAVANKHNLKLVVLFGSHATGATHEKSDIDIAVMGNTQIDFNTKLRLMTDFSDTLKRDDVEVVDLASASPTLLYVVVRDGKLLYEAHGDDFLKWKLYAIRIWMETAWLRNLRDKRLIEWAARA